MWKVCTEILDSGMLEICLFQNIVIPPRPYNQIRQKWCNTTSQIEVCSLFHCKQSSNMLHDCFDLAVIDYHEIWSFFAAQINNTVNQNHLVYSHGRV